MVRKTAAKVSSTGSRCTVPRAVRHSAPTPTSHTMYCGLITRDVVVKTSSAANPASYGVAAANVRARSRHHTSQPQAAALSASAAALTAPTYGPRNSTEP